jgi:2-C-methyl-D-erythritol 4-phosphate cytidylyltransferase
LGDVFTVLALAFSIAFHASCAAAASAVHHFKAVLYVNHQLVRSSAKFAQTPQTIHVSLLTVA